MYEIPFALLYTLGKDGRVSLLENPFIYASRQEKARQEPRPPINDVGICHKSNGKQFYFI